MARLVAAAPIAAIALIAGGGAGCLPGDERPEPGSVLLNVKRSDAAADGFVTDDGWLAGFVRPVRHGSQPVGVRRSRLY